MQTKESHDLKGRTIQEEMHTKKPQDLKGGGHEEKKPQKTQEQ